MYGLFEGINEAFGLVKVETVGIAVHPVGLTQVKRLISPFRSPQLPPGAVCPQCAYTPESNSDYRLTTANNSVSSSSGSAIRRILPKVRKPRWIVGLFVRKQS
jgi:hypothetical protein